MSLSVEIVISRYNEDLVWIADPPFNKYDITIYNKGLNDDFTKTPNVKRIINVENVGRCDHTYLYHILQNYDNLYTITVFLPGSCDINKKYKKSKKILNLIQKHNNAVFISRHRGCVKTHYKNFKLNKWVCNHKDNRSLNSESKLTPSEIRPFGKWFESTFGNIKVCYHTWHGIFSINKNDILQHQKIYYEKLEKQLTVSSNPEVGHYFERAWGAVFYPITNGLVFHSIANRLVKY
jgi:hypothetical protein